MKSNVSKLMLVLLVLFVAPLAHSAEDAKSEHATMKKEHARVHAEHDKLLKQIGKWRVEHRRILSILAEVESKILGHEAVLEELSEHAREHEDHIHHHDEEIIEHEKEGSDKHHAELSKEHKQLIDDHARIMKMASELEDNHDELVQAVTKLRAVINAKK